MVQSFTYVEAVDIAEDFEDIVDTEHIKAGIKAVIDAVTICPYHIVTQYPSLEEYYNSEEARIPLEDEQGALYTVLVVMSKLDDNSILVQDITDYVEANGITYSFPA